jgi:hypothetical protein
MSSILALAQVVRDMTGEDGILRLAITPEQGIRVQHGGEVREPTRRELIALRLLIDLELEEQNVETRETVEHIAEITFKHTA